MMRVCLFGTYNRSHSANRIYANALRASGYDLVEYHHPLWERTRDKDRSYFRPFSLLVLALRWAGASLSLAWSWVRSGGAPLALVGFNGQLDVLLLRALSPKHGPRIVYAPLVSLTETLIEDRNVYRRGSLAARLLTGLDRWCCRAADVVVVDTEAHRRYFVESVGVPDEKIEVVHLGVDSTAFPVTERDSEKGPVARRARAQKLEVLYFGQYLPLHGVGVIAAGAAELGRRRRDLRFVFVGTGEHREHVEKSLRGTGLDVEFVDWVAYEDLHARISRADIVLGVFGASIKARIVIPNKVYEAASAGVPIVTADYPAVREIFEHGRNIYLCSPDADGLADAIETLADDPGLRACLGQGAARVIEERFNDEALARSWRGVFRGGGEPDSPTPRVGVSVLNYNDAAATLGCLDSLSHCDIEPFQVLVVDNGSSAEQLSLLEEGMAGRYDATLLRLPENLGYAGGNNRALEELFGAGAEQVLLLNDDTVVTPGALRALVDCARRNPAAGPVGPRISRDWPGSRSASVGERCWAPAAWMPRSLIRYRRPRQSPYPVSGISGCAVFLTRELYEQLGGFEESYFAYYEEVDLCLRAARAGHRPMVAPAAEVAHQGHRGFAYGMSTVSAYLKARNLWRLARLRLAAPWFLLFAPGYFLMTLASAAGYLLRGQSRVVGAMAGGVVAGLRGEHGRPPAQLFEPGL